MSVQTQPARSLPAGRGPGYDEDQPSDPVVTAAVSIGTAPLPFLAVYAALFILHGTLRPVHPADITSSQGGELLAGLVALAFFVLAVVSLVWFQNRRRRWLFALVQLSVLATCVDFLIDPTKGGRPISLLLAVTSLTALVLGFAPAGWEHVGRRAPRPLRRLYGPLGPARWTESTAEKSMAEKSTAEKSMAEKSMAEKSTAVEPVDVEPVAVEPAVEPQAVEPEPVLDAPRPNRPLPGRPLPRR